LGAAALARRPSRGRRRAARESGGHSTSLRLNAQRPQQQSILLPPWHESLSDRMSRSYRVPPAAACALGAPRPELYHSVLAINL
jgi:hypothetical protein